MSDNLKQYSNDLTLAIYSTDNSFGFAYRRSNNRKSDNFFIKKFDYDLCNNLIVDFNKFISKENLKKVKTISVSIGPANFNASRLTVILARTIAQQKNVPLKSFSSFKLMSKRIALKNKILKKNESFWIYKKLKRRGFIAGKYEVCKTDEKNSNFTIIEKYVPNLVKELHDSEKKFQADFEEKEDLRELLNLANKNYKVTNLNSWQKVLPIYPLSPIN